MIHGLPRPQGGVSYHDSGPSRSQGVFPTMIQARRGHRGCFLPCWGGVSYHVGGCFLPCWGGVSYHVGGVFPTMLIGWNPRQI